MTSPLIWRRWRPCDVPQEKPVLLTSQKMHRAHTIPQLAPDEGAIVSRSSPSVFGLLSGWFWLLTPGMLFIFLRGHALNRLNTYRSTHIVSLSCAEPPIWKLRCQCHQGFSAQCLRCYPAVGHYFLTILGGCFKMKLKVARISDTSINYTICQSIYDSLNFGIAIHKATNYSKKVTN